MDTITAISESVDLEAAERLVIKTNQDAQALIVSCMAEKGGSFVKSLAQAYIAADGENRDILVSAFIDYFHRYAMRLGLFYEQVSKPCEGFEVDLFETETRIVAEIIVKTAEEWADKHPRTKGGKSRFLDAVIANLQGKVSS